MKKKARVYLPLLGRVRQLNEILSEKEAELERIRLESLDGDTKLVRRKIEIMTSRWKRVKEIRSCLHYIDDPIYGQMEVEPNFGSILFQPIVQRLLHIKQLSFAHMIYPMAVHSRLSHSLGVARNVEAVLQSIFSKNRLYCEAGHEDIQLTAKERAEIILKGKICGLLHDIGHGPFGHALDRLQKYRRSIRDSAPDKGLSAEYTKHFLRKPILDAGFDPDNIVAILSSNKLHLQGYDLFIAKIIDSMPDFDQIDYLHRDSRTSGLSVEEVNPWALIERILPYRNRNDQITPCFTKCAVPYIERLMYLRDSLYNSCYEHPLKVTAETLFAWAVDEFVRFHDLRFDEVLLLTDEEVITLLKLHGRANSVERGAVTCLSENEQFLEVDSVPIFLEPKTVESVVDCIKKSVSRLTAGEINEIRNGLINHKLLAPPQESPKIRDWVRSARDPDCFKDAFIDKPQNLRKQLAEHLTLSEADEWKILVILPSHDAVDKLKGVDAPILVKSGRGYKLLDFWNCSDLQDDFFDILRHKRLRIRLLLHGSIQEQREAAIARFRELWKVSA